MAEAARFFTRQYTSVWVAQVLEGILDDDADMADMYLARRAQLAANNAASATQQRADWDTPPSAQASGMNNLSVFLYDPLSCHDPPPFGASLACHVQSVLCFLPLVLAGQEHCGLSPAKQGNCDM